MRRAAAIALLLIAGCSSRARASANEVRIRLAVEPAHLNPLLYGDAQATQVTLGDVYEPLVTLVGQAPQPLLAGSFSHSADEREWTFVLREGVLWHDGAPFTAEDVAFTFELLRPGRAPSLLADDFEDLGPVEIVAPMQVRLRFTAFRPGRIDALALVPILPAHIFGVGAGAAAEQLATHPANRAPVGTGPYSFVEWVPGQEIRLKRWPRYWGEAPAIERAVYRIVADHDLALAKLRAGELDLILGPPATAVAEFETARDFSVIRYPFPYYRAVRWNCRRGQLADARVRRALTMLLDRPSLIREVFAGRARAASGPWQPNDPAYDPGVDPLPYDPEAAKALLREAGADRLRAVIVVSPGSMERVATIWQDDARRAGVTLDVQVDARAYERAKAGDFDGFAFGWQVGREQDQHGEFHSQGEGNFGGCVDADVDRLIDEIRRTVDAAARVRLEHALHRRLHELQFATIISVDDRVALARSRLRGAQPGVLGAPVRKMSVLP